MRNLLPVAVTAFASIGWISPARASVHVAVGDYAAEPKAQRPSLTQLGFGLLAGGSSIGAAEGPRVGLHVELGRRWRELLVQAEYNYMALGDANPGHMNRLGLTGRYSFLEFRSRRGVVEGDYWIEAGGGRELIRYDAGGRLDRNDAIAGVGMHLLLTSGANTPKPRQVGLFFGLRGTFAPAPSSGSRPASCGGPCDEPSAPSDVDYGLFFHMGMTWGR